MNKTCCNQFPNDDYSHDNVSTVPSFIQWNCSHGVCDLCDNHLFLSTCKLLNECKEIIKVTMWTNALHSGKAKGGKRPIPKEPTKLELPFNEVKAFY